MQDHFIKNVNDLSLCMTLTGDRAAANTKACTVNGNTGTTFSRRPLF